MWNGGSNVPTSGGGAGNPAGLSDHQFYDYYKGQKAQNGTGGLIIMYAKNVYNNGKIYSKGSQGANITDWYTSSGGSSGGGSINIFYKEQYLANGEINADGAEIAIYNKDKTNYLCKGGNGTITIGNISTGTFVSE